jgi:hypothetical protein
MSLDGTIFFELGVVGWCGHGSFPHKTGMLRVRSPCQISMRIIAAGVRHFVWGVAFGVAATSVAMWLVRVI